MAPKSFRCGYRELPTAAMPKIVYEQVKKRCRRILIEHFRCAASPIDAPQEAYFDRINFVATWPKEQDMEALAARISCEPAFISASFKEATKCFVIAVPWPREHNNFGLYVEKFIRVDIQLCPTLRALEWRLFNRAHGGLWYCISSLIRPYGLMCSKNGVSLRVDEIDALDEGKSELFLTSDPWRVLNVLGLPQGLVWEEPFRTAAEMYNYISQWGMSFFRRVYLQGESGNICAEQAQINNAILHCRPPVLRRFIKDSLPQCCEARGFITPRTSSTKIAHEVIKYFGIEAKVDLRVRRVLTEQQREHVVVPYINGSVPEVPKRAHDQAKCYRVCQVQALVEIVTRGETKYGIIPTEPLSHDGQFEMPRVEEFIRQNMRRVGDAAYQFHLEWCLEVQRRLWTERRNEQRGGKRARRWKEKWAKRNNGADEEKHNNKEKCDNTESRDSNSTQDKSGSEGRNGNQVNNSNQGQSGRATRTILRRMN